METNSIITSIVSLVVALGGLELFKWLWTRKSKVRIAEAEAYAAELKASADEYHLLNERIENLNEQLINKDKRYDEQMSAREKRFDEQTAVLREVQKQLNEEIKNNGLLSAEIAELKAERAMKLCQVRNCAKREPQSGY